MISLPVRMASLMKPFRFPTYSRSSEGLDRNSSYSFTGGKKRNGNTSVSKTGGNNRHQMMEIALSLLSLLATYGLGFRGTRTHDGHATA